MNSIIGQILLWVGFLSGALATVFATGDYARLGITVADNLDNTKVIVSNVAEKSNAHTGGIRTNDELVSFNGEPVETADGFGKMLGSFESESPAKIVLIRGEEEKSMNVPVKSSWATVNWIWYFISAAIGISGIAFVRAGKKSAAGQGEKTEASLKQIKAHLADLVNNTEKLNNEIKNFKPRQILNYIENQLQDDMRGFADGRDSITAEHGLQVFAEVMTQFAAGERAINRAWSASADGYIEEAATCVQRGLEMLKTAQKILQAA